MKALNGLSSILVPLLGAIALPAYAELVIRNDAGRIDSVRYDELAPMLLNEAQQQERKADAQAAVIAAQAAQLHDMQQQLSELKNLKRDLRTALLKLQIKVELVAKR
jgi:Tfp pilus assembly protein PilE